MTRHRFVTEAPRKLHPPWTAVTRHRFLTEVPRKLHPPWTAVTRHRFLTGRLNIQADLEVVIINLQPIRLETIDCLDSRWRSCPLKPTSRAPWVLVGHQH